MSIASVDRHPTDDMLELYTLGQLNESQLEDVEVHLLLCRDCQDRATAIDNYVANMKAACQQVVDRVPEKPERSYFSRIPKLPLPIWAGALAILIISLTFPVLSSRSIPQSETEITLVSSRGADDSSAANGPILLHVDTTDLTPYASYRVQLVDTAGRQLFATSAVPAYSRLSVRIPTALNSGTYWVRVNGPAGQPIREFALHLK